MNPPSVSAKYSVRTERREGIEIMTLSESGVAHAEIAPQCGSNCFALSMPQPLLEPVALEEFRRRPTQYGFPILFPYPNRIRDGAFTFRGQRYEVGPVRHGLVRDRPWKVMSMGASDQEGAWIETCLDAAQFPDEILRPFPFPFRISVTHRLQGGLFQIETALLNTGTQEMPFGLGFHPYFRRPARGAITIPAARRWELEDYLPTGAQLELEPERDLRRPTDLEGLALDDIYTALLPDPDGRVRCLLDDADAGCRMVVEFDAAQFPHVVVYTPPPPRQAICIEPYTCPTDAFNLHARGLPSDLRRLKPQETARFQVRVHARRA